MAVNYPGRDLEAMSFAVNYHRWIMDFIRPYLGTRLVEVGAGSGSFSELLMSRPFDSLALVEPSEKMYARLVENLRPGPRVRTYNGLFLDVADEIRRTQQPDSIIYVNVLEHVEDDEGELRGVHRTLAGGGRAFIFVPAFRWLFGNFDRAVGHFRRYTKPELEEKCRRAGFRIAASRYFDVFGIVPWWIKYRLLKSDALGPGSVAAYDKFVVPVARRFESVVTPAFGKSIILVAEKN